MFRKELYPNTRIKIDRWPYLLIISIIVIVLWIIWSPEDNLFNRPYNKKNENPKFAFSWSAIQQLEEVNPDSAFRIANKILFEAEKEDDVYSKAKAYYFLARIQLFNNSDTEAISLAFSYGKIANILFNDSLDPFWMAQSNLQLSGICVYLFGHDRTYKDSMSLYLEKAKNWATLIEEEPDDSLKTIADLLKAESSVVNNLDQINGSMTIDSLQLCISISEKALKIYIQIEDKEGQAISLRNLAFYSKKQGNYDEAIKYLEESRKIGEELGSMLLQSGALSNLGDCYYDIHEGDYQRKSFRSSLYYYKKSLQFHNLDRSENLWNIARLYHLAAFTTTQPESDFQKMEHVMVDSAIFYYQNAYHQAVKEKRLLTLQYIEEDYDELCLGLKENLHCSNFNVKVDDILSLANYGKTQRVLAVKQLEDFEKKLLSDKSDREKLFFLTYGFGAIFILVSIFTLMYDRAKLSFLKQQITGNLKTLQAQMNPHFISNSLNSIESLINLNENREAASYLVEFSRLARMTLGYSRRDEISLLEEIKMLKSYLSLEHLRYTNRLNYEFLVDGNLNPSEIFIPPMMIQPFVENAILHGIKNKIEGGTVKIEFIQADSDLVKCVVQDNGVGREKAMEIESKSMFPRVSYSTQITQERIEFLKTLKGGDLSVIDLHNDKGEAIGTRVEILIRLQDKR